MHENRKLEVKQMLSVYLEREHSINTNRLFQCLNPEHNDSHPSMGFYDKGASPICHCFGCNATYDIFDVIELDYVNVSLVTAQVLSVFTGYSFPVLD